LVLNDRSSAFRIVDSVFTPTGSLAHKDSLLFHVDAAGDVYQYGFVAWVAGRETVNVTPQWDRIAAFSLPPGSSWLIGIIDSTRPDRRRESIWGSTATTAEYVSATVNGIQTVLNATRVELSTADQSLNMTMWMSTAPLAIARVEDDSYDINTSEFKELFELRTRGTVVPGLRAHQH
jgi:hypothetical protein